MPVPILSPIPSLNSTFHLMSLKLIAVCAEIVLFPDPQYMWKEGLVNIVQIFEHYGILAVEI